jgi:hypothetical protein
MHKFVIGLGASILLGAACGGGSGLGDGGTTCKQSCLVTLAKLVANCQPSGTCTEQAIGTSAANVCYSNGVKMSATMTTSSADTTSMSVSVKKNSTPCYALAISQNASQEMTMVFKNASGTVVATLQAGGTADPTVTCPGGVASAIDVTCNAEYTAADTAFGNGTDCTQGACAY